MCFLMRWQHCHFHPHRCHFSSQNCHSLWVQSWTLVKKHVASPRNTSRDDPQDWTRHKGDGLEQHQRNLEKSATPGERVWLRVLPGGFSDRRHAEGRGLRGRGLHLEPDAVTEHCGVMDVNHYPCKFLIHPDAPWKDAPPYPDVGVFWSKGTASTRACWG